MRLRDHRDRFLLVSALATGLLAAGCSAQASQTAHVASTFNDATTRTVATPTVTTPPTAPQTGPGAPSDPGTAADPSSPSDPGTAATTGGHVGSASDDATPCPPPAPQLFVEGKRAAAKDGQVSFSYVDAQRLCAGDENARFVATGTTVTTKSVSPAAVVLLLAPNAGSDELQVPAPALPAAMAADTDAAFFTITLDSAGAITRIEQSYRP